MYICESLSRYDAIYEKAWVLNPHLDKWSSFDERFYGLLPIVLTQSQREGDYFGFVDDQGIVKFWRRSEEHTSELQSLMRISYAVFCLKKKIKQNKSETANIQTSSESDHTRKTKRQA